MLAAYICNGFNEILLQTLRRDSPDSVSEGQSNIPYNIVFFTNLLYKFFISIHLLYSYTCFEHYYAHLQEENCVSTASGIDTRPLVTCVLHSHLKRVTIPDAVLIQFSS